MRPQRTTYRLAHSTKDYRRCHALFAAHGMNDGPLSWPTIMAERDGELVGCLSTVPHKERIIAGPLAVTTRRPLLTITRLIDAYEVVMRRAGVTSYDFGIDVVRHKDWFDLVMKSETMTPFYRDEQAAWFHRRIP